MKILAIESTCDETAAAIVEMKPEGVEVLSNVVASSAEMHIKYGGIVPEVASREQVKVIISTIEEAIAAVTPGHIDAIAVAYGPGLIGSLLIGVETAKTLALAWNKPLIPVNHMAAHVMANWILPDPPLESKIALRSASHPRGVPELPAVALVVSGGHTDLVYMKSLADWEWIGGTRDDAAGECLDKCARLLGLPYPGGPSIEKAAAMAFTEDKFRLPRPMMHEDSLEMSFSGLKSALEILIREQRTEISEETKSLLAKEVSEAVVEVLVSKTMKAVERYRPKSLLLAGGVAASKLLREQLDKGLQLTDTSFFVPEFKYCTDNAVMIGAAALLQSSSFEGQAQEEILSVRPDPGLQTV